MVNDRTTAHRQESSNGVLPTLTFLLFIVTVMSLCVTIGSDLTGDANGADVGAAITLLCGVMFYHAFQHVRTTVD